MKTKTQKSTAKKSGVRKAVSSVFSRRKSESDTIKIEEENSQLQKFFEEELKDLYWAEKHLAKELGKLAKKATSVELQQAFVDHQGETEGHVERLEEVFQILGKKPVAKKCEAISGITKEVEEIIKETEDDTFTRDVALIVGAQKAEHYEIASYGSMVQIARTLGKTDIAEIFEETLEEEKQADRLLTHIAENNINEEATNEAAE